MRNTFAAIVLSLAAAAVPFPAVAKSMTPPATQPATTQSSNVPVKLVVLYSSGVGYFQHAGTVHGDASTELRFKTDQINDILKSLVLQDLDHGTISTITYPSQDPVDKTLASFQINIADNPSLHDLLNQLRGSKVSLDLGTDKLSGTILGVEKKPRPTKDDEKKVIELPVLNLLTDDTIKSIDFEQIRSVKLDDPGLQSELTQALAALAQSRDKDKKPVTINFTGQGDRRVSIGYVVETPVWKTSYRLVLPSDPKDKPQLQGWALVENQTDTDWNDVQLSLVSGRPISFIQDLYQPLYVPRPTVQPELYASLRPQAYDEGMDLAKNITRRARQQGQQPALQQMQQKLQQAPAATAAPTAGRTLSPEFAVGADIDGDGIADRNLAYGYANPLNPTATVASLASAAKLGELFQYTIPSVSLPRQKSAMLPIVTDAIDADRVSIYNASVLPKNPLNGALLKNTTTKHLLGGPVTVFDHNAYAGDARIDNLPPGHTRLLSFGVDLDTLVNSTHATNESHVTAGKIVKGALELTRKDVFTQDYTAENKSSTEKTLVVEHPVRPNWKLITPEKPMETTDALHRFKVDLPSNKPTTLTVKQEHVESQTIAILPCDIGQLQAYSTNTEIPEKVRIVLTKTIQLKQALADTERQINEKNQQIETISNEQTRLRENMKAVDRQSQYYTRLVNKLNDQESQIEQLRKDVDALRDQMTKQRAELENYINSTSVG